MRLLIVTQVVDRKDPYLGFFTEWLEEFAKHFERIEVICLREGEHALPSNVHVHSLGKERGASRIGYLSRLFRYSWQLRHEYDAVLIHMNQEYVLAAGWLWKLLGKRIYLWRNHYAGGFLTDVAVLFATKVFCTSRFSYTARYRKTVVMPVGVDTELFTPSSVRAPRSILFFGRFAPSKKPDVVLEALNILRHDGISFWASFYGSALPEDVRYRESLIARAKELELENVVKFYDGVPHEEAPKIFAAHEMFVNLSSSGMYDKTIFEAAASGCLVIAASEDFAQIAGERLLVEATAASVANKLREILMLPENERAALAGLVREVTLKGHSLHTLGARIATEIV
ncbi:MAG: glycosyltransferase [bacterium]|nr:glycosyltransferase [bacterium]